MTPRDLPATASDVRSVTRSSKEQMRKAVFALGSAWYSAWVDAGKPSLELYDLKTIESDSLKEKKQLSIADSLINNQGKMIGQDEGKQ